MKYFLSRREPSGTRILLIESGSRHLLEGLLAIIIPAWAGNYELDLVTCYGGLPEGFPAGGRVYRVTDYGTKEKRQQLVRELRARDYAYTGMICSAEPLMTKWKWMLAFRVPAKVFIVNENGDYFWLHRENLAIMREFALTRMGMEGTGAVRVLARLALFPFTLLYLLLYAFAVHTRRALRRAF
jgi:hypothetical protein